LCRDDIDTDTDTQLSGTDVIAMVGNYSTHVELDTNLTGTDVVAMVGNYSADEVSIANWNKTYADTLYSDSNETTNVSWIVDYITNQTADDCPSGNYSYGVSANGSVLCRDDETSDVTDSNETTNVTWIVDYITNQTADNCASGNYSYGVSTNGSLLCRDDIVVNNPFDQELNTTSDIAFAKVTSSASVNSDSIPVLFVNNTYVGKTDTIAILGTAFPDTSSWGIGVQGEGGYKGVYGHAMITSAVVGANPYGVYGLATGSSTIDSGTLFGVYGEVESSNESDVGYGVYGKGDGFATLSVGVYGDANGGDYAIYGDGVIAGSSNITSDEYFIGNGSLLTDITSGNETTNVSWIVDYITNQTADDCPSGSFATGLSDNGSVVCTADVDSNLTEDNVEAYIFDSDNTAALDMNGYPIYGVIELNVTGNIELTGGLMLGNTTDAIAGTLRWTGTALEVYDGDTWKIIASAGVECPTGFILVPGNAVLGTTTDFCVMKYEAKNVGGVATSQADGAPWVSINQTDAIAECSDIGAHLCTVNEVQTINRNIEAQGANWNSTVVGTGSLWKGHEDNSPANALVASSNDSDYYSGTGDSGTSLQRRTHTLSNGNVIWDWSGNVYEWMYGEGAGGTIGSDPAWYITAGWIEWNNTQLDSPERGKLGPSNSSWTADNGIGRYYGGVGTNAFLRGGSWSYAAHAGVFALLLYCAPSDSGTSFGLRCCVS